MAKAYHDFLRHYEGVKLPQFYLDQIYPQEMQDVPLYSQV